MFHIIWQCSLDYKIFWSCAIELAHGLEPDVPTAADTLSLVFDLQNVTQLCGNGYAFAAVREDGRVPLLQEFLGRPQEKEKTEKSCGCQ